MAREAFIADSPDCSSALILVAVRENPGHVAATAECGLEFLKHEKNFVVITAGLIFRFDVDGAGLRAVEASGKIRASVVVGVIKTETRRLRNKDDAPHAVGVNVGRAFFGSAVNIGGNLLAVPVQLLGRIGVVEHIDRNLMAFFETKQRAGELPVVAGQRQDAVGSDFDCGSLDVQRVIGLVGSGDGSACGSVLGRGRAVLRQGVGR